MKNKNLGYYFSVVCIATMTMVSTSSCSSTYETEVDTEKPEFGVRKEGGISNNILTVDGQEVADLTNIDFCMESYLAVKKFYRQDPNLDARQWLIDNHDLHCEK